VAVQRDAQPLLVAPAWVEAHCVVPDGFRRGAPFRLYDFQLAYFLNFYLVRGDARWVPDDPILGPAFVYRRGLLVGPQKIGKGPHSAAHVCLEGVGPALFGGWADEGDGYACADWGCGCGWEYAYEPGEPMGMPWPTPLIQITALSQEQVDNIYGALRPMIELGPLDDVVPRTGEEFIRLRGGGRIDAVTSSAQSRLGQRVTFVPQDEVGLWTKTNKMVAVADTQYRGLAGMGGRASLTTNAWDPSQHSVAQQQFESSAKNLYRQFKQAPRGLSYRNKRDRRRIHQVVYGETLRSSGGHVDDDSIEDEAADLLERDPAQAERFFGNRIVSGAGTWCPPELWEEADARARVVPDGAIVCVGFDGSDVDDWTALRLETIDGHRFTPTYGPDNRPTIWNPKEWNGSIPRAEVDVAVAEVFRRFTVVRMYCDPRDWKSEIGDWALEHGEKVVVEWATNRIVQMHAALERTLVDMKSGRSTHDGCPTTTIHVGNARKAAKVSDRYILAKASPSQKIDAAMADVLAHEAASDAHASGDFERARKAKTKSKKMLVLR
jgi:hypothetical protein